MGKFSITSIQTESCSLVTDPVSMESLPMTNVSCCLMSLLPFMKLVIFEVRLENAKM